MSDAAQSLLEAYEDPEVIEVIVNDDGSVFLEHEGTRLEKQPFQVGPEDIDLFLKTVLGRSESFGPSRPYADLSAADGSRVHVIAPAFGARRTVRHHPQTARTPAAPGRDRP